MFIVKWLLPLLTILSGWQQISCNSETTEEYYQTMERLTNDIKNRNIVTTVPPRTDSTASVSVNLQFFVINFDFDESSMQFTTQGWFSMGWNDKRMSWSPEEYGDISFIRLFPESMWIPDFNVWNSARDHNNEKATKPTLVIVDSNGTMKYIPPATFTSYCKSNMQFWPFDTTTCDLKIGSWTFSQLQLEIHPSSETQLVPYEILEGKWKLVSTTTVLETKYYQPHPDPYQSITYSFEIRRNSLSQQTIVLPAIAIAVLCLITFFIPPMSSAKLLVGVVQFLLISGQLVYLNNTVSANDGPTPLIVNFYAASLILVTLSLITSVLTFNWSSFPKTTGPPQFAVNLLTGGFGHILGVKPQDFGNKLRDGEKHLESDEKNSVQKQWMTLSCAIHRLAFFVFFFVFIILVSVCLLQN